MKPVSVRVVGGDEPAAELDGASPPAEAEGAGEAEAAAEASASESPPESMDCSPPPRALFSDGDGSEDSDEDEPGGWGAPGLRQRRLSADAAGLPAFLPLGSASAARSVRRGSSDDAGGARAPGAPPAAASAGAARRNTLPPSSPPRALAAPRAVTLLAASQRSPPRSPPREVAWEAPPPPAPLPPPAPPLQWWPYLVGELGLAPLPLRRPAPDRYKRERVFNTLWGVPRRLEEAQAYAVLVCVDALLALLTTLPLRTAVGAARLAAAALPGGGLARVARRHVTEQLLCDALWCAIFAATTAVLFRQDVSIIYHFIRGQEVVKLYVLFSVLEICDKLLYSFGADMLEALASSAAGLVAAFSAPEGGTGGAAAQLSLDVFLLGASVMAHALVLLTLAITLNVAVNSHNNALLALLISSNFAEVKGYVFKRMDAAKVGQLACQDAVERVHLAACLAFVAAQAVEPRGRGAAQGLPPPLRAAAPLILAAEVLIDLVKHAFMAKFNDIRPESYSEVLRELARRASRVQAHQAHLVLGFVPMAPAALLLRAMPRAAAAAVHASGGGRTGAATAGAAAATALLVAKVLCGMLARRLAVAIARDAAQAAAAADAAAAQRDARSQPLPATGAIAIATPRFWGAASPTRTHRKHA